MTLTRTRLDKCSTKGCPAPFDEEWHVPWCRGVHECFGGATHQHWPKRSQGGKEIVACLCAGMHDAVDNGAFYGNAVLTHDGRRYFRLWDIHNVTLIERVLASTDGPDGAMGTASAVAGMLQRASSSIPVSSGLSAGAGASGPASPSSAPLEPAKTTGPETVVGGGALRTPSVAPPPYSFHDNGIEFEEEYTLADWRKAAREITRESKGRQWRVGDLVNAERWAECSQDYDEIDYPPETQANYGRIAAAYKLAERRSLSFGHHQAVYKHEERLGLLDEAVANGWTRKELKAAAYPDTSVRAKQYTVRGAA
jgi:hypothetical protein